MTDRPIPTVSFIGLDATEHAELEQLLAVLRNTKTRNDLRRRYYEGHYGLKDLGISIPPQLKTLEVVVGWPAKAVDAMSRRTVLQGFTSQFDGDELGAMVSSLWDENRMDVEAPSGHTSALTHSCAFVFVTKGIAGIGEPDVLIQVRSAEDAAALWDERRRQVRAALSVVTRHPTTLRASRVNLYLPNLVIVLADLAGDGRRLEVVERIVHTGGVPVEALPYRSTLTRPFGRSRISRGVMYLTDAAVRTMLRTEVGAEFYNSPQRYALGASEEAFEDKDGNPVPAWTVMLGRLLTLTRDEEGDLPQVGQFAQQTMQPNLDQLRSIAQQFAAETALPVSSLGIVQDNPSSAEAMQVANEELGIEIEFWQRTSLSPGWQRSFRRAVDMMSGGSATARAEARTLRAHWGKWWVPNEAAAAQAALARVQAIPRLADTDVELERMGYSPDEVARIDQQTRRSVASVRLDALVGIGRQGVTEGAGDAGASAATA